MFGFSFAAIGQSDALTKTTHVNCTKHFRMLVLPNAPFKKSCFVIYFRRLCDKNLTCFEPEAKSHLVEGLEFHKFYFDNGNLLDYYYSILFLFFAALFMSFCLALTRLYVICSAMAGRPLFFSLGLKKQA